MENCLVWGVGKIGSSSVLKDILSQKYHVRAYCDSSMNGGEIINGLKVIGIDEIDRFIKDEQITVILIAALNKDIIKSIRESIVEKITANIRILELYDSELDSMENLYLSNVHKAMKFQWDVNFANQSKVWVANLISEIEYWTDAYCKTQGTFLTPYIENTNFTTYYPEYKEFAAQLKENALILDIGGGIVSKLGCNTDQGCLLQIRTIDPLAHWYNQFLPMDISESKKCQFGLFEFIADFYHKESVDGIVINNALDHCIDPFKSILECLYILKTNSQMGLLHRRAEAVYEKYSGLHRWNIDYNTKDHFIIWNQHHAINVTEALREIAEINLTHSEESLPREKQIIKIEIRKKNNFELEQFVDIKEERYFLASLLEHLMKYYAENDISHIYQKMHSL